MKRFGLPCNSAHCSVKRYRVQRHDSVHNVEANLILRTFKYGRIPVPVLLHVGRLPNRSFCSDLLLDWKLFLDDSFLSGSLV